MSQPSLFKAFGVYDTVDHCWLGDAKGPKLFTEGDELSSGRKLTADQAELMARCSAQMTGVQMEYPPKRLEHRPYSFDANVLKDEQPTKMTPLEALRRAEGGAL